MKRSELYEEVWSAPMTRLAKQLGISDVGLAKACRRHDVPAPPRGYWAKLAAGHKPPRTPLPNPKLDVEVHFTTSDPNQLARRRAIESRRAELPPTSNASAKQRASIVFAADLESAHPVVRATRRYCDRLPRLIERATRNRGKGWIDTKPEDRPPPEQHGRYLSKKFAAEEETRNVKTLSKTDILVMRLDPETSINVAADYASQNLANLTKSGVDVASVADVDKMKLAYLAHHEGAGGAAAIINGTLSDDQERLRCGSHVHDGV
jgi:hypothetical protein